MRAGIKDSNHLYYLDTKFTLHPNRSLQKSFNCPCGSQPPKNSVHWESDQL